MTEISKLAAIKLVVNDELLVLEIAKQLDIHYNSLYRWIREYEIMEKVRFQDMDAHFIIINTKSIN